MSAGRGAEGPLLAALRAARLGVLAARTLGRQRRAGEAGSALEVRRARARVLSDAARRTLALHGISVELEGSPPGGPALLASNHVSYLDPLAIAAVVPCVPISKADVGGWPVIGRVARASGVLLVERGDAGSRLRVVREAHDVVASGLPVLNFPEGTTSLGQVVLPLRPGLFSVALRARVPVVPIAIRYEPAELAWVGDATFLPHYLRLAARSASRVRVAFGAPLDPASYPGAAELAAATHARISALLEEEPAWLRILR